MSRILGTSVSLQHCQDFEDVYSLKDATLFVFAQNNIKFLWRANFFLDLEDERTPLKFFLGQTHGFVLGRQKPIR